MTRKSLLPVTLVVALVAVAPPVSQSGTFASHLRSDARVIPLPDTRPSWPSNVRSLTVGTVQEEVYAVVSNPPSIAVIAPDGGILRVLGTDVLREPQYVAVVYPDDTPRLRPDPRTARLFVVDRGWTGLVILSESGEHLASVPGFAEVGGIAGTSNGAVLSDMLMKRLVILDYYGAIRAMVDSASSAYSFDVPGPVASTENVVVVADTGRRELAWFDLRATSSSPLNSSTRAGQSSHSASPLNRPTGSVLHRLSP